MNYSEFKTYTLNVVKNYNTSDLNNELNIFITKCNNIIEKYIDFQLSPITIESVDIKDFENHIDSIITKIENINFTNDVEDSAYHNYKMNYPNYTINSDGTITLDINKLSNIANNMEELIKQYEKLQQYVIDEDKVIAINEGIKPYKYAILHKLKIAKNDFVIKAFVEYELDYHTTTTYVKSIKLNTRKKSLGKLLSVDLDTTEKYLKDSYNMDLYTDEIFIRYNQDDNFNNGKGITLTHVYNDHHYKITIMSMKDLHTLLYECRKTIEINVKD